MNTRERLLETAEHLMQERGLANVTTRAIAKEANVAEGTLYVHFPHKEDLFLAVIQRHLAEFVPTVQPEHAGQASLRDSLTAIALGALRYYQAIIPLAASLFADPPMLAQHREWMQANGGPARIYERVAAYIAAEQELGRIERATNPLDIAALLLGPCFQCAFMRHFLGQDPLGQTDEDVVTSIVTLLLPGISVPASA